MPRPTCRPAFLSLRKFVLLLAAACCALVASTVPAAEKIEGAFGIKLGQPFQPTTAPVERPDGEAYMFVPEKPNALFSTYYVYVSPNTQVVYRIVATGEAPSETQFHRLEERMAAVLNAKYASLPDASNMIVQDTRTITFFSKAKHGEAWIYAITYEDGPLKVQANEERKENLLGELAKRQKQLLQEVDSTGL